MTSFTTLLTALCDIETKAMTKVGYEKTLSWSVASSDVPTRKDSATNASIADTGIRVNTDDDIFFFNPDVTIARGNRIAFDGDHYDVIKVNKVYGATDIHHLEVVARLTDHE
jgi:hypothetical protein